MSILSELRTVRMSMTVGRLGPVLVFLAIGLVVPGVAKAQIETEFVFTVTSGNAGVYGIGAQGPSGGVVTVTIDEYGAARFEDRSHVTWTASLFSGTPVFGTTVRLKNGAGQYNFGTGVFSGLHFDVEVEDGIGNVVVVNRTFSGNTSIPLSVPVGTSPPAGAVLSIALSPSFTIPLPGGYVGNASFNAAFSSAANSGVPLTPGEVVTGSGNDVEVTSTPTLPDGSTMTSVGIAFESVLNPGITTVTTASAPGGGTPGSPSGFKIGSPPVYYDVGTTATFSGIVTLCFTWVEGQLHNENAARLFHFEDGAWLDVTTSLDTANNKVCGQVATLSPFAIFETSYLFTGFLRPVDNAPTRNTVKAGSAIPVKFMLGGDYGLSIFDAGSPASQQMQCDTAAPLSEIEETAPAGASTLSFDALNGVYTYVWKTDRTWSSSCRRLMLRFNDGSMSYADFNFSR